MSERVPTHHGERQLKILLDSFQSRELKTWFSIDYLPGVPDLDLLLLHKNCGVFAIEVKAVPIQEIEAISLNYLTIKGRGKKKSANQQAYDAMIGLMEHAKKNRSQLPFMVATTAWPQITREEWKYQFRSSPDIANQASCLIFKDDLVSHERLRVRLSHIYRNPPIRKGSSFDYNFDDYHLIDIHTLVAVEETKPVAPSISQFQQVSNAQRHEIHKKYPLNKKTKMLFEGIPGSGKTFCLLTLAEMHGLEGRSVLFLCYNKALAAQLRVNVASIAQDLCDPELAEFVQVMDIYQHAKVCADQLGIEGIAASDYEEWLDLIREEVEGAGSFELPDILLIDEVQDFGEAAIRWAEFWAANCSWVGAARGVGQELYNKNQKLLDTWLADYSLEALRTNYRNPGLLFLCSYLIGQSGFDSDVLKTLTPSVLKQLTTKEIRVNRVKEVGFEFYFAEGEDDNELSTNYESLILRQLQRLESSGASPHDLLVLVRGRRDQKRVLAALERLSETEDQRYLDLVDSSARRNEPDICKLRVSTFESSKGLEAKTVIVIGLELLTMREQTDANLALVALSRATENCLVVSKLANPHNFVSDLEPFLESSKSIVDVISG